MDITPANVGWVLAGAPAPRFGVGIREGVM